ncbi:MAG: HAD hydrolase-like protein [Candidatus Hydrogenedentes bacterium]|nr:HAD hydrolase-like protein [Candidatus Hydrogenedentota bacterium]MBI3118399.1 HAD hydrolase-like protein [Candidatus Hydrogenedentota bacterium]
MNNTVHFPNLGSFSADSGLVLRDRCSDSVFAVGADGVQAVAATGDGKVEFVGFARHTLAYVKSAMGYPAYYPVHPVALRKPVKAVLMDLDGTSVRSEAFWIWMIQRSTASLLDNPKFELEEADLPYVSGHSVSEHLQYCVRKYCPDKTIEEARRYYFEHTHRELKEIAEGRGRANAFQPAPGLKPFLLELKRRGIRIGLVTSGLYEKAWPEIISAFRTLDLGDPAQFYDAIITAGFPLRAGEPGTLGELSPKPHPWLYAETCRVGLGIPFEERHHVVGIEDSGAGICSIRLAGYTPIGFAGGNIPESGTRCLCSAYCEFLEQVLALL